MGRDTSQGVAAELVAAGELIEGEEEDCPQECDLQGTSKMGQQRGAKGYSR